MKGRRPDLREAAKPLHAVKAPAWLSKEARREWDRVMPDLIQRRILTDADLGSLENYCLAIGRVRDTEAMIQTESEAEMQLKLMRVQDKAIATSRQLAGELGLTPVSRSRPAIREDEDSDDAPNPLEMG